MLSKIKTKDKELVRKRIKRKKRSISKNNLSILKKLKNQKSFKLINKKVIVRGVKQVKRKEVGQKEVKAELKCKDEEVKAE